MTGLDTYIFYIHATEGVQLVEIVSSKVVLYSLVLLVYNADMFDVIMRW